MDDPEPLIPSPTPARPLLGHTVLVVEDSRFASEAMRLLCLRSGARIRRADCLRSARRHLRVYRPSVAVVDLGLPDGSGVDLIAELDRASPRIDVIIGFSGDDAAEDQALAAGADGFLAKPVESLGRFQSAILRHMPIERRPPGPRHVDAEPIRPDRLAFREDMAHLAQVLDRPDEARDLDYVARFLGGVARSAGDPALEAEAGALAAAHREGRATAPSVERITGLVRDRLSDAQVI